ncbi:MAG: hypothetical protein Tsb0013_24150 [Phycisphaerales bacterium]
MHRPRTASAFRTLAPTVLALGSLAVLGGCREPLFPNDENRTQFDRYDLSRSQFEPQFIEDEFGRREPNIKGRLSPKD